MLEKAGITISGGDPLPHRRTGDEPPKMACLFSDNFAQMYQKHAKRVWLESVDRETGG